MRRKSKAPSTTKYVDSKGNIKDYPQPSAHDKLTIYFDMKFRIEDEIKRQRDRLEKHLDMEVILKDGSKDIVTGYSKMEIYNGIMRFSRVLYLEEPEIRIMPATESLFIKFPTHTIISFNIENVRSWRNI